MRRRWLLIGFFGTIGGIALGCNALLSNDTRSVQDEGGTSRPRTDTPAPSATSTPPDADAPDELHSIVDAGGIPDAGECDATLTTDPLNCGGCGFDCRGDACAGGRCQNDPRYLLVETPARDDGERVDLTATGTLDWSQWREGVIDRCAACVRRILEPGYSPPGQLRPYADDDRTFTWTNGTPNATGSTTAGLFVQQVGSYFQLQVTSAPERAVLTYYIDTSNSGGKLAVALSNLPPQSFITPTLVGGARYRVRIHFSDPARAPLVIRWEMVTDALGQPYDNVAIIAATLAPDG